jgi:Ser/Thr protein kinase RdoA (MazF antagonist)
MTGTANVRGAALGAGAAGALEAVLGSAVVSASRIPWGDSRATYRVELSAGRAVAARALRGADALDRAETLARRAALLVAGGIAVAHPARSVAVDGDGADGVRALSVTPWIDGATGASALSDPDAARRLAMSMGELAGRIAALDASRLEAAHDWRTPADLTAAAERWLAAIRPEAVAATSAAARRALDTVAAAWDATPAFAVGLAHGDFAPVNVIVDPAGRLVVVDLDDLQPGPRLLDLAWWGWVVRHHHPEAWTWSWPSLLSGAGLEPGPRLDALAVAIALVRLAERAATTTDPDARAGWLRRLEGTARP